jgi:nucleotide-binding universal stress UspA family protein
MLTVMHVVSKHLKKKENPSVTIGEDTERELRQLVPHDIELRKHVHFEVVRGNAAEEIVRIASDRKAGLIVMGARQHSIAADRAPWATLSHVIRKATVRFSRSSLISHSYWHALVKSGPAAL